MPSPQLPDETEINNKPEYARGETRKPLRANTQSSSNRHGTEPVNPGAQQRAPEPKPRSGDRESAKSNDDRGLPVTPAATTTIRTKSTRSQADHDDKHISEPTRSDSREPEDDYVHVDDIDDERMRMVPGSKAVSTGPIPESRQPQAAVPLSVKSYSSVAKVNAVKENDNSQPPPGAAEGVAARGSAASFVTPESEQHTSEREHFPGTFDNDEQEGTEENAKELPAASGYLGGLVRAFNYTTGPPPPVKDKAQLYKEELQRTQNELRTLAGNLEAYKCELRRSKWELRQATNQISELIHEKQRYKDHNSSLSHELMNVNRNLQDAKNLSDVRGKELLGSQVFLTKADSLSVSEVIDKVVALNEEIFQAAATLGESMVHHRYETSQEDMALAYESARTTIGEPILDILVSQSQKPEPECNPLLVQVVLQVYIVNFCASKAASWYPSEDRAAGFLNMLYCDIRASEEQAVSGRWRAITRAHTRISSASEKWHTELTRTLSNVLKVSAWAASKDQRTSFEQRLPPIFKAVDDLRTALGEKFTSADLETSIIEPKTTFNTVYMEDAYGDGRQTGGKRAPPESVVGTTGIGLKKVMNKRGANGEIQYENVFSAKVALESTLKEALEPVSPNRLRRKKRADTEGDGAVTRAKTFMGLS
ncbi:hypothetical protein B0H34DRAFT_747493 [Crassisporium funariophilum]|nr:hypothetical protein B0H34DRAFT_747493 [Crassisporium funariophilum]